MASELRVNTLKDASGNNSVALSTVAEGSAKSWINFNGQGTPAARDSFNHASITDNGTGDYTLAYTNSFNNANYASSAYSGGSATAAFNTRQFGSNTKATGTIRVTTGYDAGTVGGLTEYDNAANEMHFMGDLA